MTRINYILLLALLMLTACTADEALEAGDGMEGAVKTEFTLAIPNTFAPTQRMASADVMDAPANFTGMQDIRIFPFHSTTQQDGEYTITGTTAFSGYTEVSPGGSDNLIPEIAASELPKNQANDKWYANLSIPVSTNALLIYGKAPNATPGFEKGATQSIWNMNEKDETPAEISFRPQPIYSETTVLTDQTEASLLVALLNQVVSAEGYETAEGELEKWSNGNNILTETYNDFITAHLHAGNSTHILKLLENLYNACVQTTALGVLSAPAAKMTLAEAIQAAIVAKQTVNERSIQLVASVPGGSLSGAYVLNWKTTDGCEDPRFPGRYNMPDGIVRLEYTPSDTEGDPGTFSYSTSEIGFGTYTMDYTKLTYPAELWYRSNSAIRVADEEKHDQVGELNWPTFISTKYNAADKQVQSTTKSIAVIKALQYAVGRLDAYVHITAGDLCARDPKDPTNDEKEVQITLPAEGLRITGLLIGDQHEVDWQFNAQGVTKYTVYDKELTQMTAGESNTFAQRGTPAEPFTRTLLYQTPGVENPANDVVENINDEVVNIAIELENNTTQAFYGEDGLVPVGGKFYLVAQLKLSDNASDANVKNIKSIFKQDYITVAKATIHSLKHAYNTIPNLTVPAQELGVSINLEWKEGVKINSTIN